MTPQEFLETVWSRQGFYVLATPVQLANGKRAYRHHVFEDISAASAFASSTASKTDIFYTVHTMKESRVWNATRQKWQTRTQKNALSARCFFFDVDLDAEDPSKHTSPQDALQALRAFCEAHNLPLPMVVSSGHGLHVYWLMTEPVPSDDWKRYATILRQAAKSADLRVDPARTTDTASLLRVAGTLNHKRGGTPVPVQVKVPGVVTPTAQLLGLLDAIDSTAVDPVEDLFGAPVPDYLKDMGTNLLRDDADFAPVPMRALIKGCGQIRAFLTAKGNVSEPAWYASLGALAFVENGEAIAQKASSGHSGYSAVETQRKFQQWKDSVGKPPTCRKMAEVFDVATCEACPYATRVNSPLVAARLNDVAAPPKIVERAYSDPAAPLVESEIPNPPAPYERNAQIGIVMRTTTAENEDVVIPIYDHDLFPLRRISGGDVEKQWWRAVLPHEPEKDFQIGAEALYDYRALVTVLSNHGVYPDPDNVRRLGQYMVAYIAELQKRRQAEKQHEHFGWTDDKSAFVLPDRALKTDGSAVPANLSAQAAKIADTMTVAGTLEEQVKLLNFYNKPVYVAQQFFIMASLAAPTLYATNKYGMVINAYGEAGASKSTTLYTAAGFWGRPGTFAMNGTEDGATTLGRQNRIAVLSNLPILMDEITYMPAADAAKFVMNISQLNDRVRLEGKTMVERRTISGAYKSALALTTSNKSLHGLLATDNTAGTASSMRVLEIPFKTLSEHAKYEGDDYIDRMSQNFGHIGPRFVAYIAANQAAVEARIRAKMKAIDIRGNIRQAERFWSAGVAVVLVATEIAAQLGLSPFDPAFLEEWAVTELLASTRQVITVEYTTPLDLLTDFLALHSSQTMVTVGPASGNTRTILKLPMSGFVAHYDIFEQETTVLRTAFANYCTRLGADASRTLKELTTGHRDKVTGKIVQPVKAASAKRTLGLGTDYRVARARCLVVDMTHPKLVDATEIDTLTAVSTPATERPVRLN